MNKKSIKDIQVKGKKCLVRCDFNVPIESGQILDDSKIQTGSKQKQERQMLEKDKFDFSETASSLIDRIKLSKMDTEHEIVYEGVLENFLEFGKALPHTIKSVQKMVRLKMMLWQARRQ